MKGTATYCVHVFLIVYLCFVIGVNAFRVMSI